MGWVRVEYVTELHGNTRWIKTLYSHEAIHHIRSCFILSYKKRYKIEDIKLDIGWVIDKLYEEVVLYELLSLFIRHVLYFCNKEEGLINER